LGNLHALKDLLSPRLSGTINRHTLSLCDSIDSVKRPAVLLLASPITDSRKTTGDLQSIEWDVECTRGSFHEVTTGQGFMETMQKRRDDVDRMD